MAREIGNVMYDEEFVLNSRGLKLFACKWIPMNQEPKALVFICHGYGMECSITMNSTAIRLAKAGYAVYGLDYEGHGKSAGLQGYVENMDYVINDCSSHFTSICEKQENKEKMRYLLGESMGGAVALLIHRKKPDFWDGAVLVAPMCKIADDMKPPQLVITILRKLCSIIPTWKIIPTKDIVDIAFKVPEVRQQVRENPYCYKGKPRLKTGHELLRTSLDLEQRLQEVSLPFIVLHGEADRVTDKSVSEQLLRVASSSDKTIKLYPEMWHGLLYGEPAENSDIVFKDIIDWLDNRADRGNTRLEREQKHRHDDFSKSK
ncbi:PREDICTED: caffeoylshikimate esterase-like [Populus euphratica]|uniref:Caffeoylshikimate esterase-like n=1 Tax=Populus euphratica TaxID=75702 RepID=A0AAJ6UDZ0_POPEU|nr:PREDICTED: caffeoylshikimate esterase-like [Populus euphratica]